jgi:hypothetical protein
MLRGITKGACVCQFSWFAYLFTVFFAYAFSNYAYFQKGFHNIGVFVDEFLLKKTTQIWELTVSSRYAYFFYTFRPIRLFSSHKFPIRSTFIRPVLFHEERRIISWIRVGNANFSEKTFFFSFYLSQIAVSILIQLCLWIHWNADEVKKFHVLNCWLWRAGASFSSLEVLHGGLKTNYCKPYFKNLLRF